MAIQSHVADLRFARGDAVIDFAAQDKPAANTAAKGDIKHRIEPNPRPATGLAQCRYVGIVIHENWRPNQWL